MAWTAPRDWTAGELITASIMNVHVRDNLNYIVADDGFLEIIKAVSTTDFHRIADGDSVGAPFWCSGRHIIADDAVLTLGNADGIPDTGIVLVAVNATLSACSIFAYNIGSALVSMVLGSDATNQGTTDLTGTTGTDVKLNFSVNGTDFHIENRLGSVRAVSLLGTSATV